MNAVTEYTAAQESIRQRSGRDTRGNPEDPIRKQQDNGDD
jgi:hypothetical protein